jgi:hypothetical protein
MDYPASGERPILIFEEVGVDLFRYLLLMPGDDGFDKITAYLATLPKRQSLPGEIATVDSLLKVWPSYPV